MIETATTEFYTDFVGTEGVNGYRLEVYRTGEEQPFRVWECE